MNLNIFKNLIIETIDEFDIDHFANIAMFIESSIGKKLLQKFKLNLNSILNIFKKQFPQFKNVKLKFDLYEDELIDIYAEVLPENLNIIRINLFPFFELLYYANLQKIDLNKLLNKILNQINTGTYENMNYPLIQHQLAHIADFKKHKNIINPHGKTWKFQLNRLKLF